MILDPSGQPIGRTLNEEDAVQLLISELRALVVLVALAALVALWWVRRH